ncbi:MAG TPA: hypothetical protein VFO52_02390 [Longimicrobiales bacterium]|nr:hypothetical protein [Longimicrobiales bacterium]
MNWLRTACLCALLFGAASDGMAQRKVNERRAIAPGGPIRILVQQGEVRVFGWEKDSIAVIGGVNETPSTGFFFNVFKDGAKLGIWSDEGEQLRAAVLHVYVPKTSQVWVKTAGANINVAAINGSLDLFSVTGSIGVSGRPRVVNAETMAGNIDINAQTPAARLKTASGVIKAGGTAEDITAVTVTGDINISLQSFGRARFESVDGQIRYYGAVPPSAVLDVINHAGGITLVIPPATAAEFAFNLYEADLNDEFGIKKRWMMSSKTKAREMTFGIGDRPAARITIRSFKGQVSIRRLDAASK